MSRNSMMVARKAVRIAGYGLLGAVLVGFASFSVGFFGPILLAPGANQGPLLGILITGPLGVVAGFGIGIWFGFRRSSAARRDETRGDEPGKGEG